MLLRTLLLCVPLLAWASSAEANDTTARVGVGGLEFVKNGHVRMLEEKLTVSQAEVVVAYRFRNEGTSDFRTAVAFPMPEFFWDPEQIEGYENIGPVESFKLSVDGKALVPKVERKALLKGRDITAALHAAHLTDEQIFRSFGDAETTAGFELPDGVVRRLARLGIHGPEWHVRETLYWEQDFPAGREIKAEHRYKPFQGFIFSSYEQGFDPAYNATLVSTKPERKDEACTDEGAQAAVLKRGREMVQRGAKGVTVTLNDVEYILGTGRNWKGPIGDFTLDVVKQNPDQIVSLCFPGKPERVDDKTLRFAQRNFVPPDKLVVNFYTLTPE